MSKNNSVEIAYQNAKDLIDKKDYIQATEQLSEILKVFPNEFGIVAIELKHSIIIIFTHSAIN